MLRSLLPAMLLAAIVPALPALADADCSGSIFDRQGCVEAREGSIAIGNSDQRRDHRETAPGRSVASYEAEIQAAFCADATADAIAGAGASQTIVYLCHGFAPLPVAQRRDLVRRAFRELPLYRGAIRTDPPTLTLVNLETYFWCADAAGRDCTTIGEAEQRITLLGQQVRIRPRILAYTWDFGDGTSQQITNGKAAHEYRHATTATITLTLTWTADYALGTGPFQPINDTTTTTSPPRLLPIREAQAVIVR